MLYIDIFYESCFEGYFMKNIETSVRGQESFCRTAAIKWNGGVKNSVPQLSNKKWEMGCQLQVVHILKNGPQKLCEMNCQICNRGARIHKTFVWAQAGNVDMALLRRACGFLQN